MNRISLLPVACLMALSVCVFADEPTDLQAEAARLRALLDKAPGFIELMPDRNSTTAFEPVPVHRWTNNERDPHGQGLLVVWTHHGRAMVTGSIYPWGGNLVHEMDSLSRGTFVCRQGGAMIWTPERGVVYSVISGAESPVDAPAPRLRQMKALADEFTVTMLGWKSDDSDREELRRLPKEFYRYKPEDPKLLDGAVFGFVKGTDPEAVLVIEAVVVKDKPQYEYFFARQTSGALEARHKGQVVWTAEKHPYRQEPQQPSFNARMPLETAFEKLDAAARRTTGE